MKASAAMTALMIGAASSMGAAQAQSQNSTQYDQRSSSYDSYDVDQGYYVSLHGGGSFLRDAENAGTLTAPFTTGTGTTIAPGTTIPEGANVGWDTHFDTGYAFGGAVGRDFGFLRTEIEASYQNNGVDFHEDAYLGASPLDGEDAGVLTPGSPAVGSTVGDVLADGQGDIDTIFVMANAFYDIDLDMKLKPYVGGGVGVGIVDVTYEPSGIPVADESSAEFAWQAMAGAAYEVTPRTDLYAGYRYRGTSKPTIETAILPADLDVENRGSIVEAGVRYTF